MPTSFQPLRSSSADALKLQSLPLTEKSEANVLMMLNVDGTWHMARGKEEGGLADGGV